MSMSNPHLMDAAVWIARMREQGERVEQVWEESRDLVETEKAEYLELLFESSARIALDKIN